MNENIELQEYAKELMKLYGLEESSDKGSHTVLLEDGTVVKLDNTNFHKAFGLDNLANYPSIKGNITIYSERIKVESKVKINFKSNQSNIYTLSKDYIEAA